MARSTKQKNTLKLGFSIYHKPVENYIDYALEHNLSHLEIDLIRNHSLVETFSEKRIEQLNHLSQETTIELSLHTPYTIELAERRTTPRKNTLEYLKNCILLAHRLNAKHITTHIGGFYGWNVWPKMRLNALSRLAENLKHLLEYCHKYNITLALENVMKLPISERHSLLGDSIEDFEWLFSKLDSEYLKMCLDTGHANLNEGPVAYINAFSDRIITIHFHDNKGNYDDHLAVGEGTVPWGNIVHHLNKIGYNGPMISECHNIEPHQAAELLSEYFEET